MNFYERINYAENYVKENKTKVSLYAGVSIVGILCIVGAIASQFEDLDPSGQARKGDSSEMDKIPLENEKDLGQIPLEDGINAVLLPPV